MQWLEFNCPGLTGNELYENTPNISFDRTQSKDSSTVQQYFLSPTHKKLDAENMVL